jgi:hypothetical protein
MSLQQQFQLAQAASHAIMSEPCPPTVAPSTWRMQQEQRAQVKFKELTEQGISADPAVALRVAVKRELGTLMLQSIMYAEKWALDSSDALITTKPYAYTHAYKVLGPLPLLQHAFWVLLGSACAQTVCERTNSVARIVQGMWRNRLTRKRFECLVLAYTDDADEAAAQAVALEIGNLVLDGRGELVEPDLREDAA